MNENIKRYFEQNKEDSFQRLDDNTCQDLNLDELFMLLDHTKSTVGQQYLYNQIRNIPFKNAIKENEEWISTYQQNKELKNKIEKLLSKLKNSDAYYICSLFQLDHPIISKKYLILYRILQFIPFVSLLLFIFLNPQLGLLSLFISIIINFIVHYKNKQLSFLYSGSIPQFLHLLNTSEKLNKLVQLKNIHIDSALKETKILKKQLSLFRFEAQLDSDVTSLGWLISELFRVFFLLEPVAINRAFISIKDKKREMEEIFRFTGLVDTLQSMSELRKNTDCYSLPSYTEESTLSAKNIYHPLITDCVKNSFSLENKSFLIMGSNMSGKTSFIRTVAINTLTAQALNFCFADNFYLQKQKIWSAISLGDSLTEGISYYLSEVLRIRTILEKTETGTNLIVIDELFKGTNTEERIAISKAVLTHLTKNPNNIVLISTHDTKLLDLMDTSIFTLIHFKEIVENNNLSFPYLIQQGKPTSRNAIKILELYNYPTEIITEATKLSK